jgi:hypothetical protein
VKLWHFCFGSWTETTVSGPKTKSNGAKQSETKGKMWNKSRKKEKSGEALVGTIQYLNEADACGLSQILCNYSYFASIVVSFGSINTSFFAILQNNLN